MKYFNALMRISFCIAIYFDVPRLPLAPPPLPLDNGFFTSFDDDDDDDDDLMMIQFNDKNKIKRSRVHIPRCNIQMMMIGFPTDYLILITII